MNQISDAGEGSLLSFSTQAWREWTVLHSGMVRIIKLFAVFILLLQLLGCLVFFLGTLSAFQVHPKLKFPNPSNCSSSPWFFFALGI